MKSLQSHASPSNTPNKAGVASRTPSYHVTQTMGVAEPHSVNPKIRAIGDTPGLFQGHRLTIKEKAKEMYLAKYFLHFLYEKLIEPFEFCL